MIGAAWNIFMHHQALFPVSNLENNYRGKSVKRNKKLRQPNAFLSFPELRKPAALKAPVLSQNAD